ncbi:MAG: hypothetical protein GWN62_16915 [Aliifodinibius sp.]|nr:hypothetical protein [Fodinibius sp.]
MQESVIIKRPKWLTDDEVKRISAIHNKTDDAETLTFEDTTPEQVEAVIYGLPAIDKKKDVRIGAKKAITGSDLEQLQLKTKLDLSKGKVFRFEAANNVIDRTNERFNVSVLEKFASDINKEGRTFLFSHRSDQIIGRVFHAELDQSEGKTALIEHVFIMTGTKLPGQADIELSEAIEAGVVDFVSVGFSAFRRRIEEDGKSFVEYYLDAENADHKEFTEQTELSAVYLGAQRGAAQKEYKVENIEFIKSIDMDNTELTAKIKELEGQIETLTTELTGKDSEIESLKSKNTDLEAIVEKYLEPFRNDILNLQGKILSEPARLTEEQVKALAPEQLMAMAKDLNEKFAGQNEPNEPKPGEKKLGF